MQSDSFYKKIFVLVPLVFGLLWGIIYLIFARLHSMNEMFNHEFIFGVAKIIRIQLDTTAFGFVFSFLDGFILGVLIEILILSARRLFQSGISGKK
ncbi:MAG: hypothetical protein KJ666_16025 [Bacteroidetes bacterium]|nr:hypothetical protein [Bacteroidota bacterium]MBU2584184.1 hypothetical protein [Bacteroidota bacterium]